MLNYRIDHIDDIQLFEDKREGEKEFKAEYSADQIKTRTQTYFNMFNQDIEYVHLKFHKDFYYVMYDTFGSDINTGLRSVENGEYNEVSVKVSVGNQFFGWLFSMHGKVEVLDPKIRAMMMTYLEELRNTYK